MEISDIALEGNEITGNIVITFCDTEDFNDIMTIKLNVSDAWKISNFCKNSLSYSAQIKKEKKQSS